MRTRCVPVLLAAMLSPACVSTELETPAAHPANPSRAGSSEQTERAVLKPGFDPFESYAPAPSSTPAEPGEPEDHAGHEGHSGHGAPAAEPQDAGSAPADAEPAPRAAPARPKATQLYTCPMHPEVVRPAPGRCPKCGMKLVPKQGKKP